MGAHVDVLAVMDTIVARAKISLIKSLRDAEKAAQKKGEPCPHSARMVEVKQHWLAEKQDARAAVAELIAADKEYDEAKLAARIGYGSDAEDRRAQDRFAEARSRRTAAIARCGVPA